MGLMRVGLIPSGVGWLDTETGGLPNPGVVVALGHPGAGKTCFALGFARAQLERGGRVCYVTSETPDALIETSRAILELDLQRYLERRVLTLLSLTPFFTNKVRSLSSVDAPLTELGDLLEERGIEHVIVDTLDPALGWIEPTNAKVEARRLITRMQTWGRTVLCTVSEGAVASELARCATGTLELGMRRLAVRQAGWCNVSELEGSMEVVQGRGLVVTGKSAFGANPADWMSLIATPRPLPSTNDDPLPSDGRTLVEPMVRGSLTLVSAPPQPTTGAAPETPARHRS
jgi:KaiC/GvpD/RAD55 family RecA-like ATPase